MSRWKGKKVGVVMGGLSSEREVSLKTGRGVAEALRSIGYDAIDIDWAPGISIAQALIDHQIDVVWNALHGTLGEDGAFQGLLACLGIPGTGTGVLGSALAMDKIMSKRVFASNGLPTPGWRVLADDEGADAVADWRLPAVVKPALEGSSVGVKIVHEREHMAAAIAEARTHHGSTLVEEFIAGREICCGVVADEAIGTCEIIPTGEFYDYEAKYVRDDTRYIVPAKLDETVERTVFELSLAAHHALDCRGYSRVDFRLSPDGELAILEVNTLPGMTDKSLMPKIARYAGIDYASLCERILNTAS